MEDLFHDELGKNIWVYIDDIFVFSDTFEEHVKDVTNGWSKMQNAGYYANPRKSVFFATKLDILGHMIDDDGIHPAPEKIRTIIDWTRPESQKELQRFNGMVNYISQFIPVTGLFLSNENTIGPAVALLALVLWEASRDRR